MQTIQILQDSLINKIAAGEVIENPTSVVKELIENAIDAKANNINIEIKGSGLLLIKVEDDGIGMSREDAILCFKRHATSKIQNFEDLINVDTMGFRGEALAAIAAVSKINLKTSQEKNIAVFVKVEASTIISVNEIARTKGTTIEVKFLFYNVPVRKKFQKSFSYINSEIIKTTINLALSKPNIGFSLILNGKKIFSSTFNKGKKEQSFKKRIKELLSRDFISSSDIDFESHDVKIFGFIGNPKTCKKTRSMQYLIINDRVVTCLAISKFIKDAYATRISEDDFPIFALHMMLPSNFIDINVHPQKKEIRLREHIFVKEAIKKAIDQAFIKEKSKEKNKVSFVKEINFNKSYNDEYQKISKENIFEKFEKQLIFKDFNFFENFLKDFLHINNFVFIDAKFLKNYLDLEEENEIIIIDLSSIYAYFLFEKIIAKKNISKSQKLLIPIDIELGSSDLIFIEENLQNLSDLGFDIRIVSKNGIAIDEMPDILAKENIKELFFLILEDLKYYNKTNRIDHVYEKKIAKKISILSKKKSFSKEDAINLLKIFIDNRDIRFDALGNPFFISLNKDKIEKFFKIKDKK